MKKKLLIAALLVIAVSILAVGTAAYNSSRAYTHSVITSGGVSIELQETMLGSDGKTEVAYKDPGKLVPGQHFSKIVRVKNLDAEAFVRVKVELVATKDNEVLDTALLTLDYDTENWTLKDGWYYYNKPLAAKEAAAGQVTTALFEEVALAGENMKNTWQGAAVSIKVTPQAVQKANNGENPLTAPGWSEFKS